jgi:hypothetical protein
MVGAADALVYAAGIDTDEEGGEVTPYVPML